MASNHRSPSLFNVTGFVVIVEVRFLFFIKHNLLWFGLQVLKGLTNLLEIRLNKSLCGFTDGQEVLRPEEDVIR